jgi:hypothetical protein
MRPFSAAVDLPDVAAKAIRHRLISLGFVAMASACGLDAPDFRTSTDPEGALLAQTMAYPPNNSERDGTSMRIAPTSRNQSHKRESYIRRSLGLFVECPDLALHQRASPHSVLGPLGYRDSPFRLRAGHRTRQCSARSVVPE